MGTANIEQRLQTTNIFGGFVGIVAVILGILGLRHFKIRHTGRVVAIIGIVIGIFVAIGNYRYEPRLDPAMQSAGRDVAKHQIGQTSLAFTHKQEGGATVTDNNLKGTVPKTSVMAPVVVTVTEQSAEGVTDADLDQTGLKNLETWVVNTMIDKDKSTYEELGYDPILLILK